MGGGKRVCYGYSGFVEDKWKPSSGNSSFSERLQHVVQSLETMGKSSGVYGKAALTIDKSSGICRDLVRNDEN